MNFARGAHLKTVRISDSDELFVDTVEKMTQMHVLLYDKKQERG